MAFQTCSNYTYNLTDVSVWQVKLRSESGDGVSAEVLAKSGCLDAGQIATCRQINTIAVDDAK
jgi:hypothetical protein